MAAVIMLSTTGFAASPSPTPATPTPSPLPLPTPTVSPPPSPASPSPSPQVSASPQPSATPASSPSPPASASPVSQLAAGPQPLPRGVPFGLSGSGFPPNTQVTVLWDDVDLQQQITTDSSGDFSWTMFVPPGASDDRHQLCAVAGGSRACITVAVEPGAATGASPSPAAAPAAPPSSTAQPTTGSHAAPPSRSATPVALVPVAAVFKAPWSYVPTAVLLLSVGAITWIVWRRLAGY